METRRDVLKKLAYVPPVIVTLSVMPSIASAGSPITPEPAGHHHNHFHLGLRSKR